MRAPLWLVFVVGCASLPKGLGGGETLAESIRAYNDEVRWERWQKASAFVPDRQRSARLDEWDEREHELKITGYELVRVDRKGEREARVQVKLEWYRSADNTVHETHAMQTWERQGKLWVVVDETRLRGPEMPGLTEPLSHKP